MTRSPALACLAISLAPCPALSSAPSCERKTAFFPPAISPMISEGFVPKVGTHSTASKIPKRPLVPAPIKIIRCLSAYVLAAATITAAICFCALFTARAALKSSALNTRARAGGVFLSRLCVRKLTCSVAGIACFILCPCGNFPLYR